jgi:hypothetical protein
MAAPSIVEVTLEAYEYNPQGAGHVGSGARTVYVVSVDEGNIGVQTHWAALSDKGTGTSTDADGKWSFKVPAGLKLTVKILDNTTLKAEYYQVQVPSPVSAATYNFYGLQPFKLQPRTL